MHVQRVALHRYRFVALLAGCAIRIFSVTALTRHAISLWPSRSDLFLVGWALLPYLLLIVLVGRRFHRQGTAAVLLLALILTDLASTLGAIAPHGSTDALILVFQPLYAIIGLCVLAVFARGKTRKVS
jgi:hypothetical protein